MGIKTLYFGLLALLVAILLERLAVRGSRNSGERSRSKNSPDYYRLLREAARGMTRVQKIDRLFKLIVYLVSARLKVATCALYYFDKKSHAYILKVKRGKFKDQIIHKIDTLSPLIEWIRGEKDIIVKKEVDELLKKKPFYFGMDKRRLAMVLPGLKIQLEELNASVCIPCFSGDKLLGFLSLGKRVPGDDYSRNDVNLLSALSDEVAVAVENALLYEELSLKIREVESLYEKEKKIFLSTVAAFATAIDAKDPYTHGHTERVTKYCLMIMDELLKNGSKFDKDFEKKLQVAALLHDVGKIGTPDQILNKKGPLTREEYEEIKKHSMIGASILYPIDELHDVAKAIKHHQERWDGLGYPDGLSKDEIPLISRILMVADAFDALVSDRPYRDGVYEAMALAEIEKCAGTQFDPAIADVFLRAYRSRDDTNFHWNVPEGGRADRVPSE